MAAEKILDFLPLRGLLLYDDPQRGPIWTMELGIEVNDILSDSNSYYSFTTNSITIGRNKTHDVVLDNKYISLTHATFFQSDDRFYVKDEGSSNGTSVYENYRWIPLKGEKKKTPLPAQIKLAGAVIITVQSCDSQILSLDEIENDSAIMVLDICGSTNQSLKNEQLAYHNKQRLNQICKPVLFNAPLQFYKNTGDGFLVTYPQTTQAVNTAIDILKTLKKRNGKSDNPPINVRIGLHKGRTYVIDPATEDIHGLDINITFRIEGLQKSAFASLKRKIGDQNRILASREFYYDYREKTRRKKEIFSLCGAAKLKGIKEKKGIYRVDWESA